MTTPPPAVTDAEAIEKLEEWRRNCLDMIESHRAGYPPLLDFEIERVERSIAVYDLLLALARDGQRLRAMIAETSPLADTCQCDLSAPTVICGFCGFPPDPIAEPVTPSAEVPGE